MNKNRKENIEFRDYFKLSSSMQKEILLKIKYSDFCYSLAKH